jgi:hypothetical protein
MKRSHLFALLAALSLGGTAFADGTGHRVVKATATVIVIDDASHVEDIISQWKSKRDPRAQANPTPVAAPEKQPVSPASPVSPVSKDAARGESGARADRAKPEPHRIDRPALPSAVPAANVGAARPDREKNSHPDRRSERDSHRERATAHHRR